MATDVVTWGRLRAPIGRNSSFVTLSGAASKFNLHWQTVTSGEKMFVATDGSMLRTYANPFHILPPAGGGPFFLTNFSTAGGTPVDFGEWHSAQGAGEPLPLDQINQLVGQTVDLTDGPFTMTSSAFASGGQTTGKSGTIVSIGNLTAIT
jgi:hypothetical protein